VFTSNPYVRVGLPAFMMQSILTSFGDSHKSADWCVRKKWMRGLSWLGGYFEGITTGGGLDGQAFFVIPLPGGVVLHLLGVWSGNMLPFGRASILDPKGAPLQICEGDLQEAELHGNGKCIWFQNGNATKAFEGTWHHGKPLAGRWSFAQQHLPVVPGEERLDGKDAAAEAIDGKDGAAEARITSAASGVAVEHSREALPAPSPPIAGNYEVAKPEEVSKLVAMSSYESLPLEPLFPSE
jgi:hypothetical protein